MGLQSFFRSSLFALLTFLLGISIHGCTGGPQSVQKKIDKIAQDMKAELPKMLDRDTKLVNVYTRKLELVSEYELVNYEPSENENQRLKGKIELYLKTQICPGIKKELLNKGASAKYIYKGKDGQVIADRLLAPGDC